MFYICQDQNYSFKQVWILTVTYGEIASVYSTTFEPPKPVKTGQANGQKLDKSKKPEKKPDKKPDAPKQDQKPKNLEEAAKLVSY